MYTRRLAPKLGALQRWVRECDATSAADGSPGDPEALKCLDLILRIANMTNANEQAQSAPAKSSSSVIHHKKPWVARGPIEGEIAIWERMQKGTLFGEYLL